MADGLVERAADVHNCISAAHIQQHLSSLEDEMTRAVCLGICSKSGWLIAGTRRSGCHRAVAQFPASAMGVHAIKLAIGQCDDPVRIAICGDDAIRLGLTLSEGSRREIMIVTAGIASDPNALAEYAGRVC